MTVSSSIARIQSFAFAGIDAIPVTVEIQIASGLPAFVIVGLPDKTVGEARERVRAALGALGLALPPKRILINLVPADLPKEGSHFDLPIALAIMTAMGILSHEAISAYAAIGELSLDGRLQATGGVLSAALETIGLQLGLICPAPQAQEARWASDALDILAPRSLRDLLSHFNGDHVLPAPELERVPPTPQGADLSTIKGLDMGRRALEITAAGGHSLLMSGPPGAGKSMLAQCLPSILPDLIHEQILECSRIHSLGGQATGSTLITEPPFRAPHHSTTLPALVGGGARSRPGEVSLAHNGVLFLDELPEFSRACLESLRQPLETGVITVARTRQTVLYPSRFQFIAAMNPCRCGYLGDAERACRKAPQCGEEYKARLSGPMLDRLDLSLFVTPVSPLDMITAPSGERSAVVRARVVAARARQIARQGVPNAQVSALDIVLSPDARTLVSEAGTKLRLSARGLTRLLRVARSIADLDHATDVEAPHLREALGFRLR
ncbi:YifB family Mg chelatase-like AAA ATPase [Asaia krungthepensis]|uniref:Magnesium chelatase-related protein n=1 Tax=Asaia krungthepensis NRIC 0535 TaxID=1307925 RepID=A0ABQ0Q1J8_9PROT|nr:YifB family Mg chelatase-like AAA ATPase [Asaia krungthepensis]GBQ86970.1 magnesium chelatase-related protein [Asaia krungthepensis NRIC 0535]